jgi:hypothetical protein
MKGGPLATLGIHGDLHPLLVRFLLGKAGHPIRFHPKASQPDIAVKCDHFSYTSTICTRGHASWMSIVCC